MATESRQGRQIQVLLQLHDGERSFGMSLAQKYPALGPKYTVVSTVFANSPADRAGVRKGYVVRCINGQPMSGLTIAQVANHFRNAGQARITLEVVESVMLPRTSAFTAAATYGVAKLSNGVTQAGSGASAEQRVAAPVTGFYAVSTGRAIAAPGSALAVPPVAAPKQPVLRLGAKPTAKSLGLQPQTGTVTSVSAGVANGSADTDAALPNADAKTTASGTSRTGLKNKTVAPVLQLGPKPKPVQSEDAEPTSTVKVDPKPAAKSVQEKPSKVSTAEKGSTSRRIPCCPVQVIEAPTSLSGQAAKELVTPTSTPALPKKLPAPAVPVQAVATVPSPPKTASVPAAKAKTPTSVSPPSVKAKKSAPVSSSLLLETAVVAKPSGNTKVHSPSLPSLSSKLPEASPTSFSPKVISRFKPVNRVATVAAEVPTTHNAPGSMVSVNSSAGKVTSPAAVIAPVSTAPQSRNGVSAPAVHPSEPAAVTARRKAHTLPAAALTLRGQPSPVQNSARATTTVSSTPAPPAPVVIPAPAATRTGKKRGRPRKNATASNGSTSNKGKVKAKKTPKHQLESREVDVIMNDEAVFDYFAFSSDSDIEESPSKKTARRTAKGRRRGATDRNRHNLTVDRLLGMGFTQEDAEASVKANGDDPDACMLWIISNIEERQFNKDLNEASIQSEQSKRDEEQRVKKLEEETCHAKKFMTLFPTSYLVCPESTASNLKKFLQSTVDQVNGETYIREVFSKLLTLEGKSIRWYKEASRSYMLELAGRLDAELGTHDVMTCCTRVSAGDINVSCALVRKVLEEVEALTKALYEMPTNQGGVPPVFLECDETTKFDLEDDGFEVVE